MLSVMKYNARSQLSRLKSPSSLYDVVPLSAGNGTELQWTQTIVENVAAYFVLNETLSVEVLACLVSNKSGKINVLIEKGQTANGTCQVDTGSALWTIHKERIKHSTGTDVNLKEWLKRTRYTILLKEGCMSMFVPLTCFSFFLCVKGILLFASSQSLGVFKSFRSLVTVALSTFALVRKKKSRVIGLWAHVQRLECRSRKLLRMLKTHFTAHQTKMSARIRWSIAQAARKVVYSIAQEHRNGLQHMVRTEQRASDEPRSGLGGSEAKCRPKYLQVAGSNPGLGALNMMESYFGKGAIQRSFSLHVKGLPVVEINAESSTEACQMLFVSLARNTSKFDFRRTHSPNSPMCTT